MIQYSACTFIRMQYRAVPSGFGQMKDVEPVPVTLTTGGLNKGMETVFRVFLKPEKIEA